MPDDDSPIKIGSARLETKWFKKLWPDDDAPAIVARGKLKAYANVKGGRSTSTVILALEELDDALAKLETFSKTKKKWGGLRKRGKKQKSVEAELANMRALCAKQIAVSKKFRGQLTVVYNRNFGAAVTERLEKAGSKMTVEGHEIKLKLLEVLVLELSAKRAEAMLNNACNDLFDDAAKACAEEIAKLVHANFGPTPWRAATPTG